MFIVNDSSKEKLCIFSTVFNAERNTAGAGNAPSKNGTVFVKWSNTSDSITSVQVTDNGQSARFRIQVQFLKIWGQRLKWLWS